MCYTGNCVWEGYMGDCTYPSHILGSRYLCNCSWDEFLIAKKQVKHIKNVSERNLKLKRIKNKLLD